MDDSQTHEEEDMAFETPAAAAAAAPAETPIETGGVFIPPSINEAALLAGDSYTHYSAVPEQDKEAAYALGVDEAGRGPVLGPMVYGVFYLPAELSDPLLRQAHHFDDSKVLTPAVRSSLVRALCDPASDLHASCGWAVSALSARDISAGMLRPSAAANYNLNAQAFDATVALIRGVLARGVNVREIYVDTVGQPAAYQRRLERIFPAIDITVAKKADSLYPCVSAASVCAKVTRDVALEVLYGQQQQPGQAQQAEEGWGSGYPSDGKCVAWLRRNMHPVFGWGPECRFSWGTAKDMLEVSTGGVEVEWPVVDDDGDTAKMTDYFVSNEQEKDADELGPWFGAPAGLEAF